MGKNRGSLLFCSIAILFSSSLFFMLELPKRAYHISECLSRRVYQFPKLEEVWNLTNQPKKEKIWADFYLLHFFFLFCLSLLFFLFFLVSFYSWSEAAERASSSFLSSSFLSHHHLLFSFLILYVSVCY